MQNHGERLTRPLAVCKDFVEFFLELRSVRQACQPVETRHVSDPRLLRLLVGHVDDEHHGAAVRHGLEREFENTPVA